MKPVRTAGFALLLTTAFFAQQASAISEDDRSMNTPAASTRFMDPDDQTPSAINLQGPAKGGSAAVDPASVRYDYDPASGSYVPHKN